MSGYVSADGKTHTVTSYGINSTVQNGFVEYDPVNNPEQALFSFQIRRGPIRRGLGRNGARRGERRYKFSKSSSALS
jgi:hypothetical protein